MSNADCTPACATVVPGVLGVTPGGPSTRGVDCTNPVYVAVCPPLPPEFVRGVSVLCDPATGQAVFISAMWAETAAAGTAPIFEYYSAGGAVWGGSPATLVQCADVSLASEPEPMCASGVTFWRWYVTKDGKPTGATFDTDLSGASFVPVGTAQPGICSTCSPFAASARSIQSTW